MVNGSRRISLRALLYSIIIWTARRREDKSKKDGMLRSSAPYPPLCILGLQRKRSQKRSVEKCITHCIPQADVADCAIDPLSNAYPTMNIFFWRSNPRSCPFLFPRKWQILDSFRSSPSFPFLHFTSRSLDSLCSSRTMCVKYIRVFLLVYSCSRSSLWNLKSDSWRTKKLTNVTSLKLVFGKMIVSIDRRKW